MHPRLKRDIEALLLESGVSRVSRWARRSGTLVLAYHNILPEGVAPSGDRSLHLPVASFREQLDTLVETHDVVSLETALTRDSGRPRPRVAITFDDAYRGALTVGLRELERRGLPATMFVAPGLLGVRSFWWDAIGRVDGRGLEENDRAHALFELAGQDGIIRDWAQSNGLEARDVPPEYQAVTEAELATALAFPGLTLGSHTWSHPNLARLSESEVEGELSRSLAWLQDRFVRVTPLLAYPYGLSSATVETAAARVGYRSAFRVDGGWMPRRTPSSYALPRFNVPAGISTDGFRLRLAGLFCR
jgi:peptidoglycan/xylan/chitin deacetylase (PgdA/CDA1 family)